MIKISRKQNTRWETFCSGLHSIVALRMRELLITNLIQNKEIISKVKLPNLRYSSMIRMKLLQI